MDFSANKGLIVPAVTGQNMVIPDLTFAPADLDLFLDAPSWMRPSGVAMVVEVTSSLPDHDRNAKRRAYAAARIPLYLLVGRDDKTVTLFSRPARHLLGAGNPPDAEWCLPVGVTGHKCDLAFLPGHTVGGGDGQVAVRAVHDGRRAEVRAKRARVHREQRAHGSHPVEELAGARGRRCHRQAPSSLAVVVCSPVPAHPRRPGPGVAVLPANRQASADSLCA
jgi:Putative restriction endonuclease